jgi:hypothetical protein
MRNIIATILLTFGLLYGYNFSGTWVNKSKADFNDPTKLIIKNKNLVTPYIKRGSKIYRLKSKHSTKLGNILFETWGFDKSAVSILIKPIDKKKIRVIVKKIYVLKKKIITKKFIFINKDRKNRENIKKRFLGVYSSHNDFSAVTRVKFFTLDNRLFVKAWQRGKYIGKAEAKVKRGKLHMEWRDGDLKVYATVKGYSYDKNLKRYKKIKLSLSARNSFSGLVTSQIIILSRKDSNTQSCGAEGVGNGSILVRPKRLLNISIESY